MFDSVRHSLLVGALDAIGVWAMLIALAAVTIAVVLLPTWREHALRARVRAGAAQLRRARYEARLRCAQEIAAAADGAAATARRHHAAWVAAHAAAEDAWRAFDAADSAARHAVQAMAFIAVGTVPTRAELVEREAEIHRVATEAHHRGELSSQQLADIVAGRNGFDSSHGRAELDTRLRLAIRSHLLHTYRQTAATERTAWHEADIAAAARSSLAIEALTAASHAQDSPQPLAVLIPRQRARAVSDTGTAGSTAAGWSLHPAVR